LSISRKEEGKIEMKKQQQYYDSKPAVKQRRSSRQHVFHALTACLCLLIYSLNAHAIPMNLADGGASVTIDPQSSAGLYDWNIDGRDYMKNSWFYVRVGSNPEQAISALNLTSAVASDSNAFLDARPDILNLTYDDPAGQYSVGVKIMLSGGLPGSGRSDMTYDVVVLNTSAQSLDMSLFAYHDLDLSVANGDSLMIQNGNTSLQADANNLRTAQYAVLIPDAHQADSANFILNTLNNIAPDNLNDQNAAPAGDVGFAYQWNFTLDPTETFITGGTAHLEVPTPASFTVLAASAILMLRRRRNTA